MWPEKFPRPPSATALRASKPNSSGTIAVSYVPLLPASRAFEIKTPASRASPSPSLSRCPPARASPSLFSVDGARPPLPLASSLSFPPLAPLPSPPAALPLAPLSPCLFFVDDVSPISLPPPLAAADVPLRCQPSLPPLSPPPARALPLPTLSLRLSSLLFAYHHRRPLLRRRASLRHRSHSHRNRSSRHASERRKDDRSERWKRRNSQKEDRKERRREHRRRSRRDRKAEDSGSEESSPLDSVGEVHDGSEPEMRNPKSVVRNILKQFPAAAGDLKQVYGKRST